jgi:hypothetical protein
MIRVDLSRINRMAHQMNNEYKWVKVPQSKS